MNPDHTTASQQAAERYIRSGFAPIPVPAGEKNPNRVGWQHERHVAENIPVLWNNGQNVGILCGEPSGGLADVDLDTKEARVAAAHILPPTRTSGRESCPASHKWYYADPLPKTKAYKLPGKGEDRSVVELRSTGAQTLVYPSRHPSGDRYVWGDETAVISRIDGARLSEAVADVATAALVAHNWPGPGARHDYALAAAGYIGRRSPRQRAERIMRAAVAASGDEEAADRTRGVADTLDKLAAGSPATGGPTLDLLAPGVVELLTRWHSWGSTGSEARPEGGDRPAFNLTDLGNARRFVHRHGANVRYCYPWGKWLVFDGRRWKPDDTGAVGRLAKETVSGVYGEAAGSTDEERRKALAKHAVGSEAGVRIREMVDLARSEVPILPDELDADPWLLNCENGTIDLTTGELREHRREDLLTKIAPVEYRPDAEAPTWAAFLERVLPGEDLRGFVQRAAGYSATADTSEQVIFIHHGPGANGKSTYQETISEALGDYSLRTPTETLLVKRSGGVPNDVARLKGARFVTASESEEGGRLAESLIKDLTGQDTISARFMRAEWFDFKPTHKLHLSTNHKPEIRGTDNAIWRRIRLVPWSVTIPPAEQDRKLPELLRDELPGVLAWIVRGCLGWQRHGLGEPEQVRKATGEYRAEMDVLATFLDDCCIVGSDKSAFAGQLWDAWQRWADKTGEPPETQKRFGGRLAERGFESVRDSRTNRKVWSGVGLHADWEARAEISPNHSSTRFAGNSTDPEPSEPKNNITGSINTRGEVMRKQGSDGSEGSARRVGEASEAATGGRRWEVLED
jgi:P4 family phage/plasmid primase-like protien